MNQKRCVGKDIRFLSFEFFMTWIYNIFRWKLNRSNSYWSIHIIEKVVASLSNKPFASLQWFSMVTHTEENRRASEENLWCLEESNGKYPFRTQSRSQSKINMQYKPLLRLMPLSNSRKYKRMDIPNSTFWLTCSRRQESWLQVRQNVE